MKVEYVFSRNQKFGSRLIAWAASFEKTGLEHTPSHAAVLLDETWVFESTFASGVRVVPYSKWLKFNEELYRIPCQIKRESSNILQSAAELWGRSYDWLGLAFFAWRYLGLIITGRALPSKNRWQSDSKYFCTEFIAKLTNRNFSMKSPARVCADFMEELNGKTI